MFRDFVGFANKLWIKLPNLTEYARVRAFGLFQDGLIDKKGRITKKGSKLLKEEHNG